jgi:hypothetical protein
MIVFNLSNQISLTGLVSEAEFVVAKTLFVNSRNRNTGVGQRWVRFLVWLATDYPHAGFTWRTPWNNEPRGLVILTPRQRVVLSQYVSETGIGLSDIDELEATDAFIIEECARKAGVWRV